MLRVGTLAKYIRENVSQNVDVIMTDEFAGYPKALHDAGVLCEHKTIKHKDGIYAIGDVYTNTVESAFSSAQARDCWNVASDQRETSASLP